MTSVFARNALGVTMEHVVRAIGIDCLSRCKMVVSCAVSAKDWVKFLVPLAPSPCLRVEAINVKLVTGKTYLKNELQ